LQKNSVIGKISYNRHCLHDIGSTPNPYEQAISIIGRTLSAFDEDNLIPCFGFGDGNHLDSFYFPADDLVGIQHVYISHFLLVSINS
jgi:E3 ubiquitin-protein ligase RGLG